MASADTDAHVQRVLQAFEVPGIALGGVHAGQSFARGYGARRMGDAAPVDADTLFPIASLSKLFTAACLGLLVDEGKLRWDDPVIGNYLFQCSQSLVLLLLSGIRL